MSEDTAAVDADKVYPDFKMKGCSTSAIVAPPSAHTAQALVTGPVSAPVRFIMWGVHK